MFGLFKSKKPLARADHLILIEPRPIAFMANFASFLGKFDEIFAHTPLGIVFVRSSRSGETAAVVPFESNFYDLGKFASASEFRDRAINDDQLMPDAVIRMADVEKIRNRLGNLGKEEIYIPTPYPFLGGSCAPETYEKGGLWPFIGIVSSFVCASEDNAGADDE